MTDHAAQERREITDAAADLSDSDRLRFGLDLGPVADSDGHPRPGD